MRDQELNYVEHKQVFDVIITNILKNEYWLVTVNFT